MKFRLLQIKDVANCEYSFSSFNYATQRGGVKLADYECTYEMEVDSDHKLDDFYYIFNMERPDDFTGRSLSVSDIVELDGYKFYCDISGWEELK